MPATPPAWDLDFAGDFLVADGREVVLLSRLNADGTYGAAVEVIATRESPNKKTVAGLMEAADLVFHLHSKAGAAGTGAAVTELRRGDRITDHEGKVWDAQGCTLAGVLDQWRVPTVQVPAAS